MSRKYHVAVDVQNLWYSCRYTYGVNYRVDFKRLQDFIYDISEGDDPVITCTAYVISSPHHDQTNFLTTLRSLGFKIKKRNLHFDHEKRQAENTRWDVGITADALHQSDSYDSFVLISGDGDFVYLAEPIIDSGKEFIVVSFEKSLNRALANSAQKVYHLEDDIAYDPRARYKERQRTYSKDDQALGP